MHDQVSWIRCIEIVCLCCKEVHVSVSGCQQRGICRLVDNGQHLGVAKIKSITKQLSK